MIITSTTGQHCYHLQESHSSKLQLGYCKNELMDLNECCNKSIKIDSLFQSWILRGLKQYLLMCKQDIYIIYIICIK